MSKHDIIEGKYRRGFPRYTVQELLDELGKVKDKGKIVYMLPEVFYPPAGNPDYDHPITGGVSENSDAVFLVQD